MSKSKVYQSLKEFYPFYLSEHRNTTCRVLHFIGTALVLLSFSGFLISLNYRFLVAMPLLGYGFAWLGHFFFEKNKPATFQYPAYSLASDFLLFFDLVRGRESFKSE